MLQQAAWGAQMLRQSIHRRPSVIHNISSIQDARKPGMAAQ